ncbi:MAG: domain containing protein [Thermomicrobiales bacterium]|nr:domain containing protein [Thermomicrobiales bacterium]
MLARLERALERIVEGSIAGIFRLQVQPAEIGRRLERAMLDGRVTSVGTSLAPNLYEVRLHPEDAAAFAGWDEALSREMETWLAELAFARGLSTVGPIQVQIFADASVSRRSVRAEGRFAGGAAAAMSRRPERGLPRPLRLLPIESGVPHASLQSGPVTVGRAEDNDLVLADPEVSRHHARLEPDGQSWRAVDLGSTNGTWINGARRNVATIAVGDEVGFGGVRYTVAAG